MALAPHIHTYQLAKVVLAVFQHEEDVPLRGRHALQPHHVLVRAAAQAGQLTQ